MKLFQSEEDISDLDDEDSQNDDDVGLYNKEEEAIMNEDLRNNPLFP